jgi:hypothetical protein
MSEQSSGIGPIQKPSDITPKTAAPELGAKKETPEAKGNTLAALKEIFVQKYGEGNGTKLYNVFVSNLAVSMVTQMQQAAASAQKASAKMREMDVP